MQVALVSRRIVIRRPKLADPEIPRRVELELWIATCGYQPQVSVFH
jgi:hypothetical protein